MEGEERRGEGGGGGRDDKGLLGEKRQRRSQGMF